MTLDEFLDAVEALPVQWTCFLDSGVIRTGRPGAGLHCDCPIEAVARARCPGVADVYGVRVLGEAVLGLAPEDRRAIVSAADGFSAASFPEGSVARRVRDRLDRLVARGAAA